MSKSACLLLAAAATTGLCLGLASCKERQRVEQIAMPRIVNCDEPANRRLQVCIEQHQRARLYLHPNEREI